MIWYVDAKLSGNDGRTAATAFKTIQHAIDVAAPGDLVVIAPGAYDQDLPKQISAARAAHVNVAVAGCEP
jgi:Protein of unknown function (DUF1565)